MIERFTVYDVFAVLVPGAVFNVLFVVTLRYLADVEIIDWTGGFGDATVVLITGYAMGVFLQALGNALTRWSFWQKHYHGPARLVLLLPESTHYPPAYKDELLAALQHHYGSLPEPEEPGYKTALRQHTYRAYKEVSAADPMAGRFLAEHHQMRAYMVAFGLLGFLALGSMLALSRCHVALHLVVAAGYAALAWLSIWQLKSKDVTLGRHVHTKFLEIKRP